VTAVDMRLRLNMEPRRADEGFMSVIVERNGELYALLVDDVGDVLWLPQSQHEPPPVTLSSNWRGLCSGLYRLEGELLLVLDIGEILTLSRQAPATPAVPSGAAVQPAKPASSLFERLGGAGAVEAAVGIFYRKVLADAHINRFFEGVDMSRQAGRQKAFLSSLMGGPSAYTGHDLRAGHSQLVSQGLADSHFDAVLGHLTATLRELGAAEADVVEAVALAAAARADVLGR
jgi:truncated hemoglobin YjbI